MRHGSLFSGIGGFDLAAEWMRWENVFHCEKLAHLRKHLRYYWPNAISYEDIKRTDFTIHRGFIDVLTGGDPCQPSSVAGLGKGTEDDRYLWPEMYRCSQECHPPWIVNENVSGSITNGILDIKADDLEAIGYEVQSYCIPAEAVGALHQRERVWLIAYNPDFHRDSKVSRGVSKIKRKKRSLEKERNQVYVIREPVDLRVTDPNPNPERLKVQYNATITGVQQEGLSRYFGFGSNPHGHISRDVIESGIIRMLNGLPEGMDYTERNKRIAALGNAIVPQIAHEFFQIIEVLNK